MAFPAQPGHARAVAPLAGAGRPAVRVASFGQKLPPNSARLPGEKVRPTASASRAEAEALRALDETEKKLSETKLAPPVPPPPAPPPGPLNLVLKEVEVQKMHTLDVLHQSFQAQIWTEFVVPGGAKDPYLKAKGEVFPFDGESSKPLFRPSLGWYMAQADYRNALEYKIIDAKTMERGDDLVMAIRVNGTFTEIFELDDYPCDVQGLTTTLNFNCRYHGPMPINISVAEDAKITMTCLTLCPPSKEWDLSPELHVRSHLVGAGGREFPGISFTARATRQPAYHITFLAAPMGFFSLLSVLNAVCLRRKVDLNHRFQMATTLVLTTAAYRVAASARLPPVSYFTMLDHYSVANAMIVLLVAIETRTLTFHVPGTPYEVDQHTETGGFDLFVTIAFVAMWLVVHLQFGLLTYSRIKFPRALDENLNDPKNILLDRAAIEELGAARYNPMPTLFDALEATVSIIQDRPPTDADGDVKNGYVRLDTRKAHTA